MAQPLRAMRGRGNHRHGIPAWIQRDAHIPPGRMPEPPGGDTMSRPYLNVRRWEWRDQDGNATPGIGLWRGKSLKAHLTPDEARQLADTLHDHADQLTEEEKA